MNPPKKKTNYFQRPKKTDFIRNCAVEVMAESRAPLSFQEFFERMQPKLKTNKTFASSGEEILRLKSYDKIQNLVKENFVTRTEDRKYKKKPNILDGIQIVE